MHRFPSQTPRVRRLLSCVASYADSLGGGSLGYIRVQQRREEQAGADTDGWEMVEHALDTRDGSGCGGNLGSARGEAPSTPPAQIRGAHRRVPSSPEGEEDRASNSIQPGHAESFGGSGGSSSRDVEDGVSSGEGSQCDCFECVSIRWDVFFLSD